mmetsp:Transcript_9981/g.19751  ORF Transcript_9981/g.19751 Transcript_9981/m.19751 type:complete len:98 (-) Transcript_9981:104-397(-)
MKAKASSYTGDYRRSEISSSKVPYYYWPLNEAASPFKARGSYGDDFTGTATFEEVIAMPTVCHGVQTSFKTGFAGEEICVDQTTSKAYSLTSPLTLS